MEIKNIDEFVNEGLFTKSDDKIKKNIVSLRSKLYNPTYKNMSDEDFEKTIPTIKSKVNKEGMSAIKSKNNDDYYKLFDKDNPTDEDNDKMDDLKTWLKIYKLADKLK